jgi:2-amino-4-hydroxy-6-hydroxymethyldihydropteridine diphosphokinase
MTRRESDQAPEAVLGLGSNLGDRLDTLRQAESAIARISGLAIIARSRVYETPPAGGPPQPDYLNAALLVVTRLLPTDLMQQLLAIEQSLGRIRPDPIRWGPRTIDIDILWLSTGAVQAPSLIVPHPRLTERAFALQPLLDLCPDACDPRSGACYSALPAAHAPIRCLGSW